MQTGKWVRRAAEAPVVVLDRGRPTARLVPIDAHEGTLFTDRVLVPGFEKLPEIQGDSARMLEEDRR